MVFSYSMNSAAIPTIYIVGQIAIVSGRIANWKSPKFLVCPIAIWGNLSQYSNVIVINCKWNVGLNFWLRCCLTIYCRLAYFVVGQFRFWQSRLVNGRNYQLAHFREVRTIGVLYNCHLACFIIGQIVGLDNYQMAREMSTGAVVAM